jgi:hypothetical protein
MKQILYILILLAVGCNPIEEGVVVEHRHEEAKKTLVLMPTLIGKVPVLYPYWMFDDEDWVLIIEGENKTLKSVYVTEECYNSLEDGDYWRKTSSCSFADDNNRKTKAD